MKLKILSLYPQMMDLYGDSGNLQILKYRAEKRGIKVEIDVHNVGDGALDFTGYDLIFMGGGSDKEQKVVASDILQYQKKIRAAYDSGVFFLLICGAMQLFGKYYRDAEDNMIKGLEIFEYYTESSTDKRERCIGNIVIESKIGGEEMKIVGFENHGGQTHGVKQPLGRVLYGNGNTFRDKYEGVKDENLIGTYLHGPLLAKNPKLADEIIRKCLERGYGKEIELAPINDDFENRAREEMLEKLLDKGRVKRS